MPQACRPMPDRRGGSRGVPEPRADGSTAEGPTLGLPILTTRTVEGRVIHEVASLVKDRASELIRPTEPPPDLRPYLRVVDIAFAIDTTASMQDPIDAARQLAAISWPPPRKNTATSDSGLPWSNIAMRPVISGSRRVG